MSRVGGEVPCAMCGTTTGNRVIDRTGCVCNACLARALESVVAGSGTQNPPTVTASDHCLLCGDPVTSGSVVAVRGPYRLCGSCLISAAKRAVEQDRDTFLQVNF